MSPDAPFGAYEHAQEKRRKLKLDEKAELLIDVGRVVVEKRREQPDETDICPRIPNHSRIATCTQENKPHLTYHD